MRRTIRFVRLQSVVRFLDLVAGSSMAATAMLASLSPVSGSSSAWPELAAGTVGSSGTVSPRLVRSSDGSGTSGASITLPGMSTRGSRRTLTGQCGVVAAEFSGKQAQQAAGRPDRGPSTRIQTAYGCSVLEVSSASAYFGPRQSPVTFAGVDCRWLIADGPVTFGSDWCRQLIEDGYRLNCNSVRSGTWKLAVRNSANTLCITSVSVDCELTDWFSEQLIMIIREYNII
ncbi:unnamed protein product [Macrosiphum euphorbiae]|uniref:CUB domain-containing protein n=1 Tax=Macrosiphum euphorbiae TaxID=13131 RepID=A0AAV0WST8_9HEMI|nr:unnamed protein product [Macrosiphum euphorbiae]